MYHVTQFTLIINLMQQKETTQEMRLPIHVISNKIMPTVRIQQFETMIITI